MIKNFSKLGKQENILGLIIASTTPTADIILDGEWLHVSPSQVQDKERCSPLLFSLVRRFQPMS